MNHCHAVVIAAAIAAAGGALAPGGVAVAAIQRPAVVNLSAELSGAAEVPGPGDADGSGSFTATLDRKSRQLCYRIEVKDIAAPTAAHIHVGDRHHADIVVQMLQTPAGGTSDACIQLGGRLARHLMLVPQEYYVNVLNAEFPNGAVRGQLLK